MIELLLIGDSLSSPGGCQWPNYLPPSTFTRNYAQVGLTLRDFDFPDHLARDKTAERNLAVIYIGTNDAGSGFSSVAYGDKLQETIDRTRHRGYTVYVVKLPLLDTHQKALQDYNRVIDTIAGAIVIDPGWGSEVTVDGLHPRCGNHTYLAGWFTWILGL